MYLTFNDNYQDYLPRPFHVVHDLASRVERLDQTPDGDHGALDGGGRLLGDVAEGALPLHVVRDAVEVALVKVVLGIHHLE